MPELPRLRLSEDHADYQIASKIEAAILTSAGGLEQFSAKFPRLLRQAIDEVIDSARSGRFTIDELASTEKTYLGTKIEILLRNYLHVPLGKKMDLLIDGIEVDVKNTIGSTWMIPLEAYGHPCILVSEVESTALCSFGIVVITDRVLREGANRDKKKSLTAKAVENDVHWILRQHPYPVNFWLTLNHEDRTAIITPRGGTVRVKELFKRHLRTPISRTLIEALAQQKDPMRRLRKNGGARDPLEIDGIVVLSGAYCKSLIQRLGLPRCSRDEFVAIKPVSTEERRLLAEFLN